MKSVKHSLILSVMICTYAISGANCPVLARDYDERVQVYLRKGLDLRDERKTAEARREFQEILTVEPDCPEAYNNIGLTYRDEGLLEKAAENYRKALAIDANFTPSLVNLGDVLYTTGQKSDALRFLTRAADISNPPDPDIHAVIGNIYRDQGKYAAAIEQYRKALEIAPDTAIAYNNLGQTLLYMKRYKEARIEVLKAIKLRPDYSHAFYNLGLINMRLNDKQAAVTAFKESLKHETNPDYAAETRKQIQSISEISTATGHLARGHDLMQDKKWGQAVAEFKKAIESGAGKDAVAWNNLGLARARLGRFEEAISCYKKSITLKPEGMAAAYYNLGQAYRKRGESGKAEDAFKNAIRHAKGKHPQAHVALGILLKEKGDFEGAQKQYGLAILQSGDNLPVVHLNLGLLLESMNESRKAVEEYKTYLSRAGSGVKSDVARSRLRRLGIAHP